MGLLQNNTHRRPKASGLKIVQGAFLAIHLGACAHAGPGYSGGSDEAPAPHLQAAADAGPAGIYVDQTQHALDLPMDEAVGLKGLLAYADLHSPVLAIARSSRSRAEAVSIAASLILPTNPEVSLTAGRGSGRPNGGAIIDLSLGQQLQIAGERGARLDAAERYLELTNAAIEEVRWTVHCDVHAAFHRVLVERKRVLLAERVVSFQEAVLLTVERQIKAGETAPLSLRLAQAEVAQARQAAVAAKQVLLAFRIQLARLTGWAVSSPPNPAGPTDAPREPLPLRKLASTAREKLPSLRTGAARVQEAGSRVALAGREAWPRPVLGVQYRRESSQATGTASSALLGVVTIPLPIFQRNDGDRARSRADVTVASAELTAVEMLLEGKIAEARSEVVAAAERMHVYGTDILPRFEENLTLLRRSFELGEIDILALSTGRERFLSIQSDALAAQIDYFVALAGLERVVGVDLWRDDHHEENNP